MDFDDAMDVLVRRAGDEITAFMAEHGGRRSGRALRRRKDVSEGELLDAARAILREMGPEDLEIRDLDEERQLRAVIEEATAQGLEAWWQAAGSPAMIKPDKRRQMWWWIQERLGGRELTPAP
jgi:hypothetical protein